MYPFGFGFFFWFGLDHLQLGFGQCDICDFAERDECIVECFGGDLAVEAADEDCYFFPGLVGHVFSFFWCFSCAGVDLSSRLLQKVGSLISRASQAHLQVPLPSFTSCQGDRCSLRRSFGEGTTGQLRQEAARDSAQYNYYLLVNIHNFPFLLQFTSLLNLLTPFVLASRMPSP